MEYNFNEYVAVQSEIEVLAENKEAMALIKTLTVQPRILVGRSLQKQLAI